MITDTEIVTYEQLLTIKQCSYSMEPMVSLEQYSIKTKPWSDDMLPYTGNMIFVRRLVANKLQRINRRLQTEHGMELLVTYGYRHQDVQKKYFNEMLGKFRLSETELSEHSLFTKTHDFIAVPSVAGHPTGGAVDLTLIRSDIGLDMGTKIADFSDPLKLPTFSPYITEEQMKNRLMLREYMLGEEFTPFNGEWWHFSFGDKEWAYWHGHESSQYAQIEFTFKNIYE